MAEEKSELNVSPEKPSGDSDTFSDNKSDREEAINEIGSAVRETLGKQGTESVDEKKDIDDTTDVDNELKDKSDSDVETSELEGKEDDKSDDEYEEIPEYLVSAGRYFGKSDEEIISLAEDEPQILEDMARLVEEKILNPLQSRQVSKIKSEEKDKTGKESKKSSFKLDDELLSKLAEDEDMSEVIEKVIKPLTNELNRVNDELGSLKGDVKNIGTSSQEDITLSNVSIANDLFDEAFGKFPELGKTDELPKYSDGSYVQISEPFRLRGKIFDIASAIQGQFDCDFGTAVQEALKWYAGGKSGKSADELLGEIKSKEKKLSPKRSRKKVVKKYASEQEEKGDIVRQAYKDAGVKPPE